jgi:uncharacterized protein with von Willebrand factor type A (vWA) domain
MDPSEDTAVQDFLEILEEHRKNCERQGKYVEAEIAKNRLDELKLHEENRRRVRQHPIINTLSCFLTSILMSVGSDAFEADRREARSGGSSHAGVSAIQFDLGQEDD